MNCQEFQNRLVDIYYCQKDSSFFDEAMKHLSICPECHHDWKSMALVSNSYACLPQLEPSSESIEKIRTFAKKRTSLATGVAQWWQLVMAGIKSSNLAPAVVMIMMAVGISLIAFQKSPYKGESMASSYYPTALREQLLKNPFEQPEDPISRWGDFIDQSESPLKPVAMDPLDKDFFGEEPRLNPKHQMIFEADADALLMRGRRLKTMGRVDLALKDFETIYYFYPEYTYMGDVLMYRAQCYAFQGKVDQAVESLEIYLKKEPTKTSLIEPMIEQIKQSR